MTTFPLSDFTPRFRIYSLLISLVLFSCQQKKAKDNQQTAEQRLTIPNWYANAVIYNLNVGSFKDSDGDGRGDFKGLSSSLPYLADLGITAIWLAPFQPSPDQDDGYDITDYFAIDKRLGTIQDFQAFMKAAKAKHIRVLMDIVINHTSVEHPWFKSARADTSGQYHNWYVWAGKQPKDFDQGMVFPGVQTETWTFDEPTGKFYFHRFYDFQPDLNYRNQQVRQMARDVLSYWINQGMDGFRLDAVPFVIDKPETGSKDPEHMFDILDEFTAEIHKLNPNAILLGEANVAAEENADYFGKDAGRLQMMFNFYANQYLFYALAKEDPTAYGKALEEFREKPSKGQWVHFLRNHDEIDLDRLEKKQRELVYERFGPEASMQLYDRGIRRRLAPMLSKNELIRLAYSILFSAPGAQMIRYGEEIGMGDDLALRERLSVRTPMQWNESTSGGFSANEETYRTVIAYGDYAYQKINVASQLKNRQSLLQFVRSMIRLRRQHPEIGLGSWKIHDSSKLLIIEYKYQGKRLLTVHNFSRESRTFEPANNLSNDQFKPLLTGNDGKTIPAYGFQWFDIQSGI
jgi:maltose alpha-D-glucosyltransferase/alpha-amylase